MDASALDKIVSTLEKQISGDELHAASLECWLKICTAAVVIGVAAELLVLICEHIDERHEWKRGTIKSPARPKFWLFLVGILAALLVTVGVAGELWIGSAISTVDSSIRTRSGRLVSLANQRAASDERDAEQLRKDGEELRRQAESERMARLKLRAQMLPRRLNELQARSLAAVLKGPKGAVAVVCELTETESFDFANDINRAIHDKAHWETYDFAHRQWIDSRYGVFVGTLNGTHRQGAELMIRALKAAGVPSEFMDIQGTEVNTIPGGFQPDALYIMVGSHPPIPSGP